MILNNDENFTFMNDTIHVAWHYFEEIFSRPDFCNSDQTFSECSEQFCLKLKNITELENQLLERRGFVTELRSSLMKMFRCQNRDSTKTDENNSGQKLLWIILISILSDALFALSLLSKIENHDSEITTEVIKNYRKKLDDEMNNDERMNYKWKTSLHDETLIKLSLSEESRNKTKSNIKNLAEQLLEIYMQEFKVGCESEEDEEVTELV